MSMKIVLNKLTSMVLVICMLLSLAAPAVGEEPLTQPVEETVYSDGSTVYADGTVMYADGTIVYAAGTTVHADGTTVNTDGTTVYPDGTTVYAEDSSDSDPAEESVHLTAPEPIIPDTVIETPENPEEPEELKEPEMTPADPAVPADPGTEVQTETDGDSSGGEEKTAPTIPGKEAENPEEATADATEEATEENAEKTAEGTEDDTAEEPPEDAEENPAAPAEELPLRTLTVSAGQMAFRDQYLNPTEPVLWSGSVWNWLYGTAIEPAYTDGRVTVEISGHLPETVTARAMFVEFADPSAARNDERALMLLDVALLDEGGAVYVPTEKLHVSVSAGSISGAAESGEPFAAYFDDSYDGVGDAGDIKVRLDENIDGSRLAYAPEQNEALRFWEAGGRLITTGNGTVEFDENRFPFRFVLSAQQEAREEESAETEQENVVKDVSLSGTLVASDGYTYEVSVSYPANCGIPEGAQLSVEELIVGTDAYWDYINQSAAELGVSPADLSLARAFDISFVDPETGERYQPTQDVQVSILLISTPVNTEEEISVLHFDDEAGEVQAMDVALNGEAIEFETGGFSVYVVLQRVIEKTLTASDGNTYQITVDYDSASGIPNGVELNVQELLPGTDEYLNYIAHCAAELGLEAEYFSLARAFDISLMDPATGTAYQPNKEVKVSIHLLDQQLNEEARIDVLHFGDEVEAMNCALNGEIIEFTANGFSVYVVVCTTLRQTLTASDNNEYLVTVTYDHASGIPSDAELSVSEIKEGEAGYEEYVAQSAAALGEKPENLTFARPFDITLKNPRTGEEYQPNGNVQVSIELLKDDLNSYASVDVVHIPDGADEEARVMDSTVHGESVEFETSGFSVYVLCAFTVDFHWGDYTWSIEGESEITLGELFEKLGVTEITLADVQSVSFSNTEYIEIEQMDSDWLLRSRAPFNTEEKLTLVLANGQSVEIKVTDEGIVLSAPAPVPDLVYNGEAQDLITAGSVENGVVVYSLTENGEYTESIPTGTDAETYTVYYKMQGQETTAGTVIAEIAKADPVVTAPTPVDGLVYTGEGLALINGGATTGGTIYYAFGTDAKTVPAENTEETTTWSETIPAATNSGTYYVWYKIAGNNNYNGIAAQSLTATISPATHNPRVSVSVGEYNAEANTITYTVLVETEGDSYYDGEDHPVTIDISDISDLFFQSGSYTYVHREGFVLPDGASSSEVTGTNVTETTFDSFPLTVAHMYDGDTLTLTYTAAVVSADYVASDQAAQVENTVSLAYDFDSGNPNIATDTSDDTATVTTTIPYVPLTREYVTLDGSWAYWRVTVNPKGYTIGNGDSLTLADTFDDGVAGDAGQSIDYSSVSVTSTGSVTYDYSGNTGTFVIPDNTPVIITYRTRITAQPGEAALFRGTAVLKDSNGETIDSATAGVTEESVVIYPSPSDVSGSGNYMMRMFVYAEGEMQTGIEGAQFILLDANQRALEYKVGSNAGDPVTFTTGADGYVDIMLDEEAGDVSIEKNTGYYLEMIRAVEGYQKDNTLYSFMITDDPSYSSGGFYKYYNGDTMKVRLYPASAGLSVSIHFSGSYALREDQQNAVTAVLQILDDNDEWEDVERHPYTDSQWGSIKFNTTLQIGDYYRVIEENQNPWDLPDNINLTTTYYCLKNAAGSDPYAEPQEFYVDTAGDSISVVIDNRYEEPQLTLVKMDKETGIVLPGAVFSVRKAHDNSDVTTYTTDANGEIVITGGADFESEVLYYVVETNAPTYTTAGGETIHYLLPLEEDRHYFYFCNDPYLIPTILEDLPAGKTAINLTESGDRITIDNQKETITIPVMKLWQGNTWPTGAEVVLGLYQSVVGGEAEQVLYGDGTPRTVTLNREMPYNNSAFSGLPSRDGQGHNIEYSIKEESVNSMEPVSAGYVQEYGISSAGVYIVRNKPATTLTVSKEWYDLLSDQKVTDETTLAAQSSITFDVYRSATKFTDPNPDDGITKADMTQFVNGLVKVREGLSFDASDDWTISIDDLDRQDDLGQPYYYYVLETVPSFGNELYEVNETAGTVTIKNKIAPETVNLTVTKAELVDDPRPESLARDFEFTLKLNNDLYPIRGWQVYTDAMDSANNLVTDWNGEVTFTLKPTNPDPALQPTEGSAITLNLPAGVTATVTESYLSEYTVATTATTSGSTADNGRTFSYVTSSETDNVALTYINTLRVICKVVKDDGTPEPFESLKSALAYIRANSSSFTAPWTIFLLEDYTIPVTDEVSVRAGENLTLTTAPTDATDGFPFKGGAETDRAVITRGGAGGSMLKNAGTLTLKNICLDGGGITATGDGGLVNSTGTLNLNAGAVLRHSIASSRGGAVYAEGTVNIVDGVSITGNSSSSASALYLKGTLNMTGGSITGNTGASDGAVVAEYAGDLINLSGNPVIFNNTNTQSKAANLYVGADSDSIMNVVSPGLGTDARIGVSARDGHMQIGEQFATTEFEVTANLDRFINDAYGYRGKLKDGTSTNVVWDGLTMTIKKVVDPIGAKPNDRFRITLSSPSIAVNSYIIDGTLDYTISAARQNRPGMIIFTNVKAGDEYTISPLPVGDYTIEEEASNYTPSYTVSSEASETNTFTAEDDCAVIVTNTRRLAKVNLTKTLDDRLKTADETQDFVFTVKLTEADGTAVSGFALTEGITTNTSGEATITLSPSNNTSAELENLKVPVGAIMTITETANENYNITASALTMPTEGEGVTITDADADNTNVFAFAVTDDGAGVTFANVRKMAEIELSKKLTGKVSATESFTFTVTLTRADGDPAASYMMYRDDNDSTKNIVTDENGKATITFDFGRGESSKAITLTIPEGTKLEVEENAVKKTVGNEQQNIYNTNYSINEAATTTDLKATINPVSDSDHSIAFSNARKMQNITVKNTVSGYSGNVVPFTYTATVTDGGEGTDDYDENGFTDGVMTFDLTTGQSQVLTVPYGATLNVEQTFIVGYDTTVSPSNYSVDNNPRKNEFQVTKDLTLNFTNTQLIGLRLVNNTSATLENVKVTITPNDTGIVTKIFRVNSDQTDQEKINDGTNKYAMLSIASGETVILEISHKNSVTHMQDYRVEGVGPAKGYYYTINNEPSFHEYANPAILRFYDEEDFSVRGGLRYSVQDSIVTFTEQPLVSFDANGGTWTTEMEGYRDRDGDRKVYQFAVTSGEAVSAPLPSPVYTRAENVSFAGWTTDESFASTPHTAQEDFSGKLYDFSTPVEGPFTLYALWKNGIIVTYKVDGGIWTETDESFVRMNENTYRQLIEMGTPAAKPADPIAPDHYAFLGWTADESKAGTIDTPEAIAQARAALYDFSGEVTADLTLYAVYAKTVTVTFNLSKSEDVYHTWTETDPAYTTVDDGHSYAVTLVRGDIVKQPASPTWAGEGSYPFLKWTTSSDYRGSALSYENMGAVTGFVFDEPVTESVTLYTSWVNANKLDVTVVKRVENPIDVNKAFNFQYHVDEGAETAFTLKAGETRVITIYFNDDNAQSLTVSETIDSDYSVEITPTKTGSADAFDGGVISGASYTVAAAQTAEQTEEQTEEQPSFIPWDTDEGVTVTFKNKNLKYNHIVTVENNVSGGSDVFSYTAKLTSGGSAVSGAVLAEGLTTDENGLANFTITGKASKALTIPHGAKLTIRMTNPVDVSTTVTSGEYEDADSDALSFTIEFVDKDGAVTFTSAVCKITDDENDVLYDANGNPAVYMTLQAAFTAYAGTLYMDASHTTTATPTAVKMLVDEYTLPTATAFPNATMTLTTAEKDDTDFPYVGVRNRATIYRSTAGAGANCFTLASGNITLTEIVLDGGSENGVKIAKAKNGGLIYMNNAEGFLNIETGTTLRNCEFAAYDDGNNSRGGAIYMTNGTLNVSAGLFSNLHAYHGGAIAVTGGTLNITGTAGSTQFENCCSERQDGGAIYHNVSKDLLIDGGNDKDNPGIIFTECVAKYTNGTGDGSDGGAIFATSNYTNTVTVKGCSFIECSARTGNGSSTAGYGGGGICAYKVKGLTVEACTFESCDTLCGGGAVAAIVKYTETVDNETVTITNCSFNQCNCKGQAGALGVYQDDNGKTNSATKLSIIDSSFTGCSSGTNNGSGGAVQCYLPCMVFSGSSFTDCWAGKEGGAVNNFYGSNYTQEWSKSYMTVTNCRFIRCRAEDRYDTGALQHYGGGINTKVKTVTVTGSYFEDCVSTLREGGALHIGGQGGGSKATITGSTFKNCTAKNGGGALLSSHETLEISNCNFYGCGSSASNGGAVYHYKNSRGDSAQKYTTISGSTFSADPDDNGSTGCSAGTDGGAIWTRAATVEITGCTIDGSAANGNGGGIYLKKNGSQNATISGGSIKNCQATNGSAVYAEHIATFSGELEVSGNTVSNINDGAIHGGTLYFEGNVVVQDNTCGADSEYDHDVLMQNDNNTTIYTTAIGLGSGANIGVYVRDDRVNKHGLEGKPFGTHGTDDGDDSHGANYLDCFFNDRDSELYGYKLSDSDSLIYWGTYVCKITDANGNTLTRPNGRDAVYQRLTMALDEFTKVSGGDPVYIKMLVETYNLRQDTAITNFPGANITLTTEAHKDTTSVAGEYDGKHPYRGTEGTVSTISRTNSANQLFKLNNADATFQLEDITLDGRKDKTKTQGDYRMIEVTAGNLVVNGGTTFQYGRHSSNDSTGGGAICVSSATGTSLEINSTEGKDVHFDHCTQNQSYKNGGGAIYAVCTVTVNSDGKGKTCFNDCSARSGGAIMVNYSGSNAVNLTINGAEFTDCFALNEGGAVYQNNNNLGIQTTVKNSRFVNCYNTNTTTPQYAQGGALATKAETLTVDTCQFKDCHSVANGGAINHGAGVDNRVKTELIDSTFEGCYTDGTNTTYGYGGSVYTQAKEVQVTDSAFQNSTSTNHGGALYLQSKANDSVATITGTSFENCSTTREGGYGGAIYSLNKALTLQKSEKAETTINACTAPGYSGAVYMATENSILNISDGTVISSCYADKGGAIYLKNKVTLNLTGSPEFTRNGFTTQSGSIVNATEGACIYLVEGSRINLSGSPKFSRNILPNLDRIPNGGVTDFVRQDLYLAGYSSNTAYDTNAASIYVVGELTGDTIWVWPKQAPHRLPNEQFAKIADDVTVTDETLSHLRNSLADNVTTCTNGEYLAGVQINAANKNIYWDKMYTISFRKIDNKGVMVPDAEFTLYTDKDCTNAVATAISADGENDTGAQGNLLARGTVEFTSVRIGVYYMKETKVPTSFRENNATYLVLVGTPYLSPNDNNKSLWEGDGPLNVTDAATLVQRHTTDAGKYYAVFPLDENNKAVLRANLTSNSVGIENIRSDYQISFMKVDGNHKALPGAAFTIYTAILDSNGDPSFFEDGYPQLMLWSRDGENYPAPVVSADGTSAYRDVNNNTLAKGLVYFRELPLGTYYLLETAYPERNGDGRRAFYAESDRVFKLDVVEDENVVEGISITLSEWKSGSGGSSARYEVLSKDSDGYYVVSNQEVVCKLTDANNNLLYVEGHVVRENKTSEATTRLFPAVYSTLEEGFDAAQNGIFVYEDGTTANVSSLKLKVLKDFTLSNPVNYNSTRAITFTTAETVVSKDRYIFSTTRTTDASRALISRAYNEDVSSNANAGGLITLADGANMILQNIRLSGNNHSGRAIHVTDNSSLTIGTDTRIEYFKQEASGSSTDGNDVKGGAILLDDNTSFTINGGYNRTAEFSGNEIVNRRSEDKTGADGGAIAVGANCTFSITNAQFSGNKATATADKKGNGGAISINETRDAEEALNLAISNVVFSNNTASYQGGALRTAEKVILTVDNSTFQNNKATNGDGGAIAALSKADSVTELTVTGGTFTNNTASKGNGGAIKIGGYGTLNLDGMTMSGNSAKNGGAVTVAPGANASFISGTVHSNTATANGGAFYVEAAEGKVSKIFIRGGSITGNSAVEGSAVYAQDYAEVTISGGSITGNTVSGDNGGAINVGGLNTQIFFTGSPIVYENYDSEKKQQKNVVLSEDSNGIIRTGEDGLGTEAIIGVYVIDKDLVDGENLFAKHGQATKPFGTFGDSDRANPQVFINDRNTELRGIAKDEEPDTIFWSGVAGSRRVILRKVVDAGGSFQPVNNAQFGVFTDEAGENAAEGIVKTESEETTVSLDSLTSKASGILWIGELPYGTYYLKEMIGAAYKVFVLTVDENGVGYLRAQGEQKNYSNHLPAEP